MKNGMRQYIAVLALIMAGLFGGVVDVWGDPEEWEYVGTVTTSSGSHTYNKWYVIFGDRLLGTPYSNVMEVGTSQASYNIWLPNANTQASIGARCYDASQCDLGLARCTVYSGTTEIKKIIISTTQTWFPTSSSGYTFNLTQQNQEVNFRFLRNFTCNRTAYYVSIPVPTHIALDYNNTATTSVTHTFANTYLGSETGEVTIPFFSFLTASGISLKSSSGDTQDFVVTSSKYPGAAGFCAMKPGTGTGDGVANSTLAEPHNYYIKIKFKPQTVGNNKTATYTIGDGTNSVTVTVKGNAIQAVSSLALGDASARTFTYGAQTQYFPQNNITARGVIASGVGLNATDNATITNAITFTSPNTAAVSVNNTDHTINVIKGNDAGNNNDLTVNLTASYAGNTKYQKAEDLTVPIIIKKAAADITLKSNTINVNANAGTLTLNIGDNQSGSTADIKCNFFNSTNAKLMNGNTLTVTANNTNCITNIEKSGSSFVLTIAGAEEAAEEYTDVTLTISYNGSEYLKSVGNKTLTIRINKLNGATLPASETLNYTTADINTVVNLGTKYGTQYGYKLNSGGSYVSLDATNKTFKILNGDATNDVATAVIQVTPAQPRIYKIGSSLITIKITKQNPSFQWNPATTNFNKTNSTTLTNPTVAGGGTFTYSGHSNITINGNYATFNEAGFYDIACCLSGNTVYKNGCNANTVHFKVSLDDFGNVAMGSASVGQSVTIDDNSFTGTVNIQAPADFQVSLDNSSWSSSLQNFDLSSKPKRFYVRFRPTTSLLPSETSKVINGNITVGTVQIPVTGTITWPAVSFDKTYIGQASEPATEILASGVVTVTAPNGYFISTDGTTWSKSITNENVTNLYIKYQPNDDPDGDAVVVVDANGNRTNIGVYGTKENYTITTADTKIGLARNVTWTMTDFTILNSATASVAQNKDFYLSSTGNNDTWFKSGVSLSSGATLHVKFQPSDNEDDHDGDITIVADGKTYTIHFEGSGVAHTGTLTSTLVGKSNHYGPSPTAGTWYYFRNSKVTEYDYFVVDNFPITVTAGTGDLDFMINTGTCVASPHSMPNYNDAYFRIAYSPREQINSTSRTFTINANSKTYTFIVEASAQERTIDFGSVDVGKASTYTSYSLDKFRPSVGVTNGLSVTAPENYLVSKDGSTWSTLITFGNSDGAGDVFYIKFAPESAGDFGTTQIYIHDSGITAHGDYKINVKGKGVQSKKTFTASINSASTAQSFTMTNFTCAGNVQVDAPTGYKVSTSENGTYSSSITIGAAGTFYVRFEPTSNSDAGSKSVTMTDLTTHREYDLDVVGTVGKQSGEITVPSSALLYNYDDQVAHLVVGTGNYVYGDPAAMTGDIVLTTTSNYIEIVDGNKIRVKPGLTAAQSNIQIKANVVSDVYTAAEQTFNVNITYNQPSTGSSLAWKYITNDWYICKESLSTTSRESGKNNTITVFVPNAAATAKLDYTAGVDYYYSRNCSVKFVVYTSADSYATSLITNGIIETSKSTGIENGSYNNLSVQSNVSGIKFGWERCDPSYYIESNDMACTLSVPVPVHYDPLRNGVTSVSVSFPTTEVGEITYVDVPFDDMFKTLRTSGSGLTATSTNSNFYASSSEMIPANSVMSPYNKLSAYSGLVVDEYNNHYVRIYFKPTTAGDFSGAIKLNDGSTRFTINVSGKSIVRPSEPQYITWNQNLAGLTSGTSLSASSSSGLAVTYTKVSGDGTFSVSSAGVVSGSGHGIVKASCAAGTKNGVSYSAAEDVVKDVYIGSTPVPSCAIQAFTSSWTKSTVSSSNYESSSVDGSKGYYLYEKTSNNYLTTQCASSVYPHYLLLTFNHTGIQKCRLSIYSGDRYDGWSDNYIYDQTFVPSGTSEVIVIDLSTLTSSTTRVTNGKQLYCRLLSTTYQNLTYSITNVTLSDYPYYPAWSSKSGEVDFGSQKIGQGGITKKVIAAETNCVSGVVSAKIEGDDPDCFQIVGSNTATLSCDEGNAAFDVRFVPTKTTSSKSGNGSTLKAKLVVTGPSSQTATIDLKGTSSKRDLKIDWGYADAAKSINAVGADADTKLKLKESNNATAYDKGRGSSAVTDCDVTYVEGGNAYGDASKPIVVVNKTNGTINSIQATGYGSGTVTLTATVNQIASTSPLNKLYNNPISVAADKKELTINVNKVNADVKISTDIDWTDLYYGDKVVITGATAYLSGDPNKTPIKDYQGNVIHSLGNGITNLTGEKCIVHNNSGSYVVELSSVSQTPVLKTSIGDGVLNSKTCSMSLTNVKPNPLLVVSKITNPNETLEIDVDNGSVNLLNLVYYIDQRHSAVALGGQGITPYWEGLLNSAGECALYKQMEIGTNKSYEYKIVGQTLNDGCSGNIGTISMHYDANNRANWSATFTPTGTATGVVAIKLSTTGKNTSDIKIYESTAEKTFYIKVNKKTPDLYLKVNSTEHQLTETDTNENIYFGDEIQLTGIAKASSATVSTGTSWSIADGTEYAEKTTDGKLKAKDIGSVRVKVSQSELCLVKATENNHYTFVINKTPSQIVWNQTIPDYTTRNTGTVPQLTLGAVFVDSKHTTPPFTIEAVSYTVTITNKGCSSVADGDIAYVENGILYVPGGTSADVTIKATHTGKTSSGIAGYVVPAYVEKSFHISKVSPTISLSYDITDGIKYGDKVTLSATSAAEGKYASPSGTTFTYSVVDASYGDIHDGNEFYAKNVGTAKIVVTQAATCFTEAVNETIDVVIGKTDQKVRTLKTKLGDNAKRRTRTDGNKSTIKLRDHFSAYDIRHSSSAITGCSGIPTFLTVDANGYVKSVELNESDFAFTETFDSSTCSNNCDIAKLYTISSSNEPAVKVYSTAWGSASVKVSSGKCGNANYNSTAEESASLSFNVIRHSPYIELIVNGNPAASIPYEDNYYIFEVTYGETVTLGAHSYNKNNGSNFYDSNSDNNASFTFTSSNTNVGTISSNSFTTQSTGETCITVEQTPNCKINTYRDLSGQNAKTADKTPNPNKWYKIKVNPATPTVNWNNTESIIYTNNGDITLSAYTVPSSTGIGSISYNVTQGGSYVTVSGNTLSINTGIGNTLPDEGAQIVVTATFTSTSQNYTNASKDWTFTLMPKNIMWLHIPSPNDNDHRLSLSGLTSTTQYFDLISALRNYTKGSGSITTNYPEENVTYTIVPNKQQYAIVETDNTITAYKRTYSGAEFYFTITATENITNNSATTNLYIDIPRGVLYFITAGKWTDASNWSRPDIIGTPHNQGTTDYEVEIRENCFIGTGKNESDQGTAAEWAAHRVDAACHDLKINYCADYPNAKLVIGEASTLKIKDNLLNSTASKFVLTANKWGQASVVFGKGSPKATIEMFLPAGNGSRTAPVWQYRGIAVEEEGFTATTGPWNSMTIYWWKEADNGNLDHGCWNPVVNCTSDINSIKLKPWVGYAFANMTTDSTWLRYTGTLINSTHEFMLTKTNTTRKDGSLYANNGVNLITNSFAAPMTIGKCDFTDANATVTFFNSGTYYDWQSHSSTQVEDTVENKHGAAGQRTVCPKFTTGTAHNTYMIPSGQSFFVTATKTSGSKITFKYDSIKKYLAPSGQMFMPAKDDEPEFNVLGVRVKGKDKGDRLVLLECDSCSRQYDNGYDGYEMREEADGWPHIYAYNKFGNTAVNADSTFNKQYVGFAAGSDDETYTISFETDRLFGYHSLYLVDRKLNETVDILAGETYSFKGYTVGENTRFQINGMTIEEYENQEKGENDEVADLCDLRVVGNTLFVEGFTAEHYKAANIEIYDMTGNMVWSTALTDSRVYDLPMLPQGIYTIRLGDCHVKYTSL